MDRCKVEIVNGIKRMFAPDGYVITEYDASDENSRFTCTKILSFPEKFDITNKGFYLMDEDEANKIKKEKREKHKERFNRFHNDQFVDSSTYEKSETPEIDTSIY